ncbi:MAG: hypothetical protein LBM65_05270 [Oscillospiraceae bacterium]|jgi:hypothetical protein|nr:hypothetical protein [Oscillospiraceae bacterium]
MKKLLTTLTVLGVIFACLCVMPTFFADPLDTVTSNPNSTDAIETTPPVFETDPVQELTTVEVTYPNYDGTTEPETEPESEPEPEPETEPEEEWEPETNPDDYDYDSSAEHEMFTPSDNHNDTIMSGEDWSYISNISIDGADGAGASGGMFKNMQGTANANSGPTWLLYIGTLFIILAAAGLAYFVLSIYMQNKRKNAPAGRGKPPVNGRRPVPDKKMFKYDTADIPKPKRPNGGGRYRR